MAGRMGACCLLFLVTSPAVAVEAARPERFLAANSMLYVRFDGVEAHRKAFDGSVVGELMHDELGDFFDYLADVTRDSIGPMTLKSRVLNGEPAKRLHTLRKAFQHVPNALRGLGKNGFVAGVEVITPLGPRGQVTMVFPEAGREENGGLAAFHLLAQMSAKGVTERKVAGRTVYQCDAELLAPFHIAWWQEGTDIVVLIGTEKPERTLAQVDQKKRSILDHPLFKEVEAFKEYETVGRGFIELEKYIKPLRLLNAGGAVIDALGVDNLQWATFHLGFEGRNMRTSFALRAPGKRVGLLGMLTAGRTVGLEELPPLPSDAASFHAFNLDPLALYDLLLGLGEGVLSAEDRKELQDAAKDLDERLGVNIRNDLVGALGSQWVLFNSPAEGPFSTGLGLIVEVKDEAKLKTAIDAALKSLPLLVGDRITVRKKRWSGIDLWTVDRGSYLAPSFAVHRGRLVVGFYPQTVRGHLRRVEGKMAAWKPTPLFEESMLAAKKKRGKVVGLSMNDPRPPLRQMCPWGPILAGILESSSPGTIDVGRLPHVQALTEPLYPSASVITDDDDTIRVETRGSLGLPFLEPPGADGMFLLYYILQVF